MRRTYRRYTPALALALCCVICSAGAAPEESAASGSSRPVEAKLNALKKQSDERTPPEVLEAGRKGTEQLRASGLLEQALGEGDTMPAFSLADAHGKTVAGADLLADGPVVLVFYRGAWCPFCNLYLQSLQGYLLQFREQGASLVAISGENPDNTLTVEQKNELTFTVLSDPNFDVARSFGIVYEMPEVTNDAILKLGFDLTEYYGTAKAELPLSATYVIDRDGSIVYAFLDPDYKKRAEPADLLQALAGLQ